MDLTPCRQCQCRGYLEMGTNECACTHTEQDHAVVVVHLPARRCSSGSFFSPIENPATFRTLCALCNGAYFIHTPPSAHFPVTPNIWPGSNLSLPSSSTSSENSVLARYIQPPPSPLANIPLNTGTQHLSMVPTPHLRLWSPPGAPVSGNTNDRCRAPHGVSASPLTSVPLISRRAGRSGEQSRGSARRVIQRVTQNIKYLVVIHPEPVYGTVATEFDRLFREVHCPVPQKIGSFLHQAESLGLSFKFETMARPDEFAGPLFDTQVTQHLEGKGFAFSCPLGMSNVETMSRYTWSFLMTGKSQRSAFGAKLSSSRKSAEDVTHKDLANNAEKLPAPSPLHDHRLVFILPLQYIITGPLQGHGMHLCLAPKLWNKHFHPDIHEQDTEFTCADGCSEELSADSEMDFVNPDIESSALFPPIASGSRTSQARSLPSPVNRAVSLSPLHAPQILSLDTSTPNFSMILRPRHQSSVALVTAWRERLAAALTSMRSLLGDDTVTIIINANTASLAAQAFINNIKCWSSQPEDALRSNVQLMGVTITGLTPISIITGHFDVSIGDGVGNGVLRSFWNEVIRIITEDSGHWQCTCDGYWVPIVTSLPPCDEDIVAFRTYGIIFRTSLLMDLEMLPISPIILLFLISDYTTAIASSFTTTVAPIGSERLRRWPPSYVTNTATGRLELSISPATELYSMILDIDASAQIGQLRRLPETALAELGHRLQCQTFFGNQIARDTPDHVIYSSMRQAFDCLIGDNVTLREHIGAQDTPSSIIGGIFGGRILSSAEQVIRLLAINVTPIGSSNDIIIARFKLHLERYIRGSGTPTLHDGSDLFGMGSLEDDPLLRAREFLRCITGSDFLPACPQQKIPLNFQTQWSHSWGRNVGIHIHTCFYAIDVLLDQECTHIVEQDILADTSISTDFDRWMHSCTGDNASNNYNTLNFEFPSCSFSLHQ
ncbi:hypothetical protein CY34DRAFT_18118 [Suillus luteus UH-Slu-Lm8-n1]|uniref:Uncharacterized protein n=1 Tax=Suillus luteus UH-Slu-Lm8-n1 TaxID=930992 RepID=A0A0D0APF2_9AGAM|nr:hypothetical protein CY34DRAFT_18118 [Suillus luteus UH-Slu-Lm8-n1]